MNFALPILEPATPPPLADATDGLRLRDSHGRYITDLRLSVTDR